MCMCVFVHVRVFVYVCVHTRVMCVCVTVKLTLISIGDVSCFGGEGCAGDEDGKCGGRDCYALAFGIPAILMIISLIIFIAGSRLYIKNKPPGGNNIFFMFFGCLWV